MSMTLDDIRSARRRDHMQVLRSEQRGDWRGASRATGIPIRFWSGQTLDDLEARDGGNDLLREAIQMVKRFGDEWEGGVGITAVGPPGVGKTTIACLIAVELARAGFMVRFTTMPNLIKRMQEQITLSRSSADEDVDEWSRSRQTLQAYSEAAHLLVLDDVGKEHRTASNYVQDVFDQVVRTRYDNGLPTIITSNLPLARWEGEYNASMADFVHESSAVVSVDGESFRRRR